MNNTEEEKSFENWINNIVEAFDEGEEFFSEENDIEVDDIIMEELNSGIRALDISYLFDDKRVEKLVEPFQKAIHFMKSHTNLTEEQILEKINESIREVELKDGYEDNPNGVGYVDGIFNILSVNFKILEESPEEIYEFIRHEMTHMLGNCFKKKFFEKKPILISGYSEENVFDIENTQKENESFNEAAVEMFNYQDEEYREEKIFGEIPIQTNQDFNVGLYCVNSNLIHQMLLARGLDRKSFFQGLYNYRKAQKNIRKFPRKIFRELSKNMDRISSDIDYYFNVDDKIYEMEQSGQTGPFEQEEEEMKEHKEDFEKTVGRSEKVIIDKLLLPRLKKIPMNERQGFLEEYFKFLICEKEYFKQKTGYQKVKPIPKTNSPWFKHYDVEPLSEQKLSQNHRTVERDRDI